MSVLSLSESRRTYYTTIREFGFIICHLDDILEAPRKWRSPVWSTEMGLAGPAPLPRLVVWTSKSEQGAIASLLGDRRKSSGHGIAPPEHRDTRDQAKQLFLNSKGKLSKHLITMFLLFSVAIKLFEPIYELN